MTSTSAVLVVDGANVVGSRPDGWWRDRAAAARRLGEQLTAAGLPYDEIVLVLEGTARAGVAAGRQRGMRAVHARGGGDDTVVEEARTAVAAGREVVVVTADQALQARVRSVGATTVGPGWLLSQL